MPTTRDKDATRKRQIRSESARIEIPECKNPKRREACLDDPELFLLTYFGNRYGVRFGRDHRFIIETIAARAENGGRQAVAAPRGRGKSEIVKGMIPWGVCAQHFRFPLPIAATTALAKRLYDDFKKKFSSNPLLLEDFPEICFPIRALDGAPQRASRQHVNGVLTNIVWTGEYISFPHVPGSPYGGVKMAYYGLDAAFRGANIDGDRPDFVLIDDPETSESAKSLPQIEDREKIIDQDISGLVSQEENLAMVILTTVQNRYCLSYRLTDPKQKPAFNGRRFGMFVHWPANRDLWDNYIARRHAGQASGDEHGRNAVQYYLDNRESMDAGVEMITDEFVPITLEDGTELVHSRCQQEFNKIADTDLDSYCTEYQNEPPEEEQVETLGLTAGIVQQRVSGMPQREVHEDTECRTMGIDIGNHYSHWVDTAWRGNAIGDIPDYGIMETHYEQGSTDKAIELALLRSLEAWAEEVVKPINPVLVLVDSGSGKIHTQAVYEFCRRMGRPFYPSKGWDSQRFRMPNADANRKPLLDAYASRQVEENVWLYNVNTEAWKRWVHQRFMTQPLDDASQRTDGSLMLFSTMGDEKRHLSFAKHITAEEEQLVPVNGKELKRVWFVKNRNNHYLDALALACAAAGCVGIRLIQQTKPPAPKVVPIVQSQPITDPYGRPFVARR